MAISAFYGWMRCVLLNKRAALLFFVGALLFDHSRLLASDQDPEIVQVTFDDDGTPVGCKTLQVELRFDGRTIKRTYKNGEFTIPAEIEEVKASGKPAEENTVGLAVECAGHKLRFPHVNVHWLGAGYWKIGVDYPPFLDEFRRTRAIERGAWISYLQFEPRGYHGFEMVLEHPKPPGRLLRRFRKQRPEATGASARDIAFALAVFRYRYEQNRDYLLGLLENCAREPENAPEDDICDMQLLDEVTNLYWRGDSTLLRPLMQLPASHPATGEIGTFYADALGRNTADFLGTLPDVPVEKQRTICESAGADEFSMNQPAQDRVTERLRAMDDDVAHRCLQELERAANDVPWRQPKN